MDASRTPPPHRDSSIWQVAPQGSAQDGSWRAVSASAADDAARGQQRAGARTPAAILDTLQHIGLAVLEAVEVGGEQGAAGGVLFAALQAQGASLGQCQSFMSGLVGKGMLVLDGQCYLLTDAGRAFKAKLAAKLNGPVPESSVGAQDRPPR